MKKVTAMLLSLLMCFSLMAIPAQAALSPDLNGPGITNMGEPQDPTEPGDQDPDEPGCSAQSTDWPDHKGEVPID